MEENVVKVSAKSNVGKVAGRIAKLLLEHNIAEVEVRCVGAGAINQGIKGIIKAKTFIVQSGKQTSLDAGFCDVNFDPEKSEEVKTGVAFFVKLK